jgi:carbon monoxide dehydrogenase subunit G
MRIENRFDLAVPIDEVWPLLIDIERISPCIPGFRLTEIEGDEYRGQMSLKVGAVTVKYACKVRFVSLDGDAHTAVIAVSGRETTAQGGMEAEVHAVLTASAGGTVASVVSEVTISGKLARFGRNLISDVSARLTEQFVRCLESRHLTAASA